MTFPRIYSHNNKILVLTRNFHRHWFNGSLGYCSCQYLPMIHFILVLSNKKCPYTTKHLVIKSLRNQRLEIVLKLVCACYTREEGQFYRQIFDMAGIESILKYKYHTRLLHYSTKQIVNFKFSLQVTHFIDMFDIHGLNLIFMYKIYWSIMKEPQSQKMNSNINILIYLV